MTDSMKSLVYHGPGNVTWGNLPIPEPGPGQIRARIDGITTCPHWDLHLMSGEPMFPNRALPYPYPPGQPGHEAVGRVDALGAGVDGPPVGTRVAAWRDQGHDRPGCYAEYNVFDAPNLLPIPEDLPLSAIAPLELAMCVQVSFDQLSVLTAVQVDRFGVTGLGPAGLIAVQMAKAYGAREVIAVDPVEERRLLALELGADAAIAPDALSGSLDAGIDCTGLADAVASLMAHTRLALSTFGVLREPVEFGFKQWGGGLALLGYGSHNRDAAKKALQLVIAGDLNLAPLVTHTLPLSRYADGIKLLRSRKAIKVLYVPE